MNPKVNGKLRHRATVTHELACLTPFNPNQNRLGCLNRIDNYPITNILTAPAMQDPHLDLGFDAEKVFCIGFGRTGTTSLERALRDLGYRLGDQRQGELVLSFSGQRAGRGRVLG